MMPKMTFSLSANLPASSFQKCWNCAVEAAMGSVLSPMILPLPGCCEGSRGISVPSSSKVIFDRVSTIVSHVVVRVNDSVSTLDIRDVVDCHLKVVIVSLVELPSQAVLCWAHALKQEGDTEEVDALTDEDINGALIDELVVDAISARETCAIDAGSRVDAELATAFVHASVVDLG